MKSRVLFIAAIVIIIVLLLSEWLPGLPVTSTALPTMGVSPTSAAIPSPTSEATPTPIIPAYLQITPSSLAGTKLQFWYPWTNAMGDVVSALVSEFNSSNEWGISVEAIRFRGEQNLEDQASQSIDQGKYPNVIAAASEQLIAWQNPTQVLVDLNDYVFSPSFGLTPQEQSDYFNNVWSSDVTDGFRFGIPATRSSQMIFYNQTWAQELGFNEAPKTTEDFRQQACAAAIANSSAGSNANFGTGGWFVDTSWKTDLSWLYAFGVTQFPETKAKTYDFETSNAQAAQTFLRDLFENGCSWKQSFPEPSDDLGYFADRSALFYAGDIIQIPEQLGALKSVNSSDVWTVIPFPGADGKPVVLTTGKSYAIFLSTPEKQLASWLFIRWLSQTSNQVKLAKQEQSLPITYSGVQAMTEFADGRPQWQAAENWLDSASYPPRNVYWQMVTSVIEDSYWILQSPQYTIANIPRMAKTLDETIQDVLSQVP